MIEPATLCDAELEARLLEAEAHALELERLGGRHGPTLASRWMAIAAACRDELARRARAGEFRASHAIRGDVYDAGLAMIASCLERDERWQVSRVEDRVRVSCPVLYLDIASRAADPWTRSVRGAGTSDVRTIRERLTQIGGRLGRVRMRYVLVLDTPDGEIRIGPGAPRRLQADDD
ncbi:MAG TPA: hypothetical protein VFQ53_04980 [Kofleriaceae bacterium]|nr:hypothetical protein [Kofleriaceae bacterium]